MTMSEPILPNADNAGEMPDQRKSYTFFQRTLLVCGAAAGFVVVMLIARAMGLPATRGMSVSILGQPHPVVAIIVTAMAFALALGIATVFAGSLGKEAPLACAAVALVAISRRGGAMRYTLFDATSSGVFLQLAIEVVALFAIVIAGWWVLERLEDLSLVKTQPIDPYADATLAAGIQAMIAQALAMLLVMSILCQTDDKMQAIASVFVAGILGSLGACGMTHVKSAFWLILGPCIAGVVAYTYFYINPGPWQIGQIQGYFAPLARPLPIDYASAGVAGAIAGKWVFESWGVEEEEEG